MSAVALIDVVAATLVDGKALLDAALASLAAGIFVTLTASLAIYGFASAADLQRDGRDHAAIAAVALAVVATLAFAAAIGLGLYVMIDG